MDPNDAQIALNTLINVKEHLLENLVDELVRHQDDDASSFSIQEIEDRFAIRLANLNTLIATLQEQNGQYDTGASRVVVEIEESNRQKLEGKLNEIVEFVSPDEVVHLSVVPTGSGKFLIVLAHGE